MCGRYTLTIDKSTIEKRFGGRFYIAQQEFEPTFNAAPSQMLPIIRTNASQRIELATWGFWPENWKRSKHIRPQINARLETALFTSPLGARRPYDLRDDRVTGVRPAARGVADLERWILAGLERLDDVCAAA